MGAQQAGCHRRGSETDTSKEVTFRLSLLRLHRHPLVRKKKKKKEPVITCSQSHRGLEHTLHFVWLRGCGGGAGETQGDAVERRLQGEARGHEWGATSVKGRATDHIQSPEGGLALSLFTSPLAAPGLQTLWSHHFQVLKKSTQLRLNITLRSLFEASVVAVRVKSGEER